jgi:hypothetical protein
VGEILSSYNLYQKKSRPRGEGGRRLVAYHFNPRIVTDLCARYLRDGQEEESGNFYGDTPPDDVSTCTKGTNNKNITGLTGTKAESGTCPPVDQEAQEGQAVHHGACTTKDPCTEHVIENTIDIGAGTLVHGKKGGVAEKKGVQVRCRDCGKANINNGYSFCGGTPWNGIPGQSPDALHPCQDFIPIKDTYEEKRQ